MKQSVPRRGNNFCQPSLTVENRHGLALWNLSLVLKEIAQENASKDEQVKKEEVNAQTEIRKPPPPSFEEG